MRECLINADLLVGISIGVALGVFILAALGVAILWTEETWANRR